MQRTLAASLGGFIATAVLSVAAASGQASAGDATWRAITRNDVDAAYRLLLENHPGAAPALRDEDFANRLERGHTLALERADRVSEYGGYVNTLRGFAGSFGDDHIAFRPNDRHAPVPLRWAGYVIALRGENYIVDAVEGQSDVAVGDRLTACDGIQASALAQRRLAGFFGNWTSRAEHYLAAPYLLIDYGNPFVPTPTVCTFERHGASIKAALRWRPVDRTQLRPMLSHAAPSGAPGFGVRRVGSAYWIAIQQLDPRAARVIDEVRAQLPEVRAAPLVVVDVRGNGGGNSDWADSLAEVLWGKASLAALHGAAPEEPACGKFWRASPGNLQTLETYAARPNEFPDPGIRSMLDAMKRAIAQGRPFTGDVAPCLRVTPQVPTGRVAGLPAPALRGKVVVLTDAVCFSSCLLLLAEYKALGALHAGQTTGVLSRYMEVRAASLPSGFGSFSTLQAVTFEMPPRLGPFDPELPYAGDISATAALEAWIPTAVQTASQSRTAIEAR